MKQFVKVSVAQKKAALGPNPPKEFLHWEDFEDIPFPKDGDWLAAHREAGQSFQDFQHQTKNVPTNTRRTIYLQPFGVFAIGRSPSLSLIEQYVGHFYGLPTKMRDPINPEKSTHRFTTRVNAGRTQYLVGDILGFLKETLPSDAYCMLAISMEDLYPQESWNFVFGSASLSERVGVFSFARFDPGFYSPSSVGQRDYQKVILKRSLKVLVHETGHMFGIAHCIYFNCLMRGSNHIEEADSRPVYFCPICLRKLQHSIGFDVVAHYKKLQTLWQSNGFNEEYTWFEKRIKTITEG